MGCLISLALCDFLSKGESEETVEVLFLIIVKINADRIEENVGKIQSKWCNGEHDMHQVYG